MARSDSHGEPVACPTWQDVLLWFRSHRVPKGLRIFVPRHLEPQAKGRYEAVAQMIDFRRDMQPYLRTAEGNIIKSKDEMALHLASRYGVSLRTIWNWHARFRKAGYGGLANEARSDKGVSRSFDRNPRAQYFVEEKYLGKRFSMVSTHKELIRAWPDLCSNPAICPPSHTTVRRYLNSLPRLVVALAREGPRRFKRLCGDQYERIAAQVAAFVGRGRSIN
jgi:hypothetical protein